MNCMPENDVFVLNSVWFECDANVTLGKMYVVLLGAAIMAGLQRISHASCFARWDWKDSSQFHGSRTSHPNVKKLKQAQGLVRKGKLNKARAILVNALILAPISPVTHELRDLLGEVNTQIFFSKEPSPRKTEYIVKRGDALVQLLGTLSQAQKRSFASTISIPL